MLARFSSCLTYLTLTSTEAWNKYSFFWRLVDTKKSSTLLLSVRQHAQLTGYTLSSIKQLRTSKLYVNLQFAALIHKNLKNINKYSPLYNYLLDNKI